MSHKIWQRVFSTLLLAGMLLSLVAPVGAMAAPAPAKTDSASAGPVVEKELQNQIAADASTGYLIYFREKADLSKADKMDWQARGRYVYALPG
jgi:hypothetical protein